MISSNFLNSENKFQFIVDNLDNNERLLRLFAVACCYKIWNLIEHDDSKNAVKTAELYADGLATDQQLTEAKNKAFAAYHFTYNYTPYSISYYAAYACASVAAGYFSASISAYAYAAVAYAANIANAIQAEMQLQQSIILQNMKGKWQNHYNTSTVNSIAQNIYDNKSYDLFPILADALQDAGCNDEEMLEYCRNSESFFFRGCWVLDKAGGKR